MRDICLKYKDFTTKNDFRISVGTWNVNGGKQIVVEVCSRFLTPNDTIKKCQVDK